MHSPWQRHPSTDLSIWTSVDGYGQWRSFCCSLGSHVFDQSGHRSASYAKGISFKRLQGHVNQPPQGASDQNCSSYAKCAKSWDTNTADGRPRPSVPPHRRSNVLPMLRERRVGRHGHRTDKVRDRRQRVPRRGAAILKASSRLLKTVGRCGDRPPYHAPSPRCQTGARTSGGSFVRTAHWT
jgi:hypothetical protein